MRFNDETEAITYVFESIANSNWRRRGLDEETRNPELAERLLEMNNLPIQQREYAVVTGSKGKGSVAAITAKLLQSLGHRVGLLTSPHLFTYRQRFRINGRMISEGDLIRLVDDLAPAIDGLKSQLREGQYLSPQAIFLAMALKWFDENQVTAAVIEVGRGGRYDDNAVVPNVLSMFTPIIREHARYLGASVERIAWHKAGIIKPRSYAYSLPQSPQVMDILSRQASAKEAEFAWLTCEDIGTFQGLTDKADGIKVKMGRYGMVDLPLLGRYEIDNASLAVWGAGNMHGRLQSTIKHGSEAYIQSIRYGLENVIWPGRAQKLQSNPAVYVDGAINTTSARLFIDSLAGLLNAPTITVAAVPMDRDYGGVYQQVATISDELIITQTERNITMPFPDAATALACSGQYHERVVYVPDVRSALNLAIDKAGHDGTVLLALAQPAVGDVMQHYGLLYEQI